MSEKHGLDLIKTIQNNPTSQNLELIYNDLLYFQSNSNIEKFKNDICELINTTGNYLIVFEKQNNESENIFDTFCCLDFMSEFVKLSSYGIYEIDLQLIKTLSILLINIKNKTFLYFLFSKNYLNKIISQNYNSIYTDDDDFISYYINFLKSLSLLLDKTLIQLFYIQKYNIFPLVENVIKYYNHKDSMIKNVVKNTVINILKVNDDKIQEHFCMLPSILYFVNIVKDLADLCFKIQYEINMKKNKKQLLYLFDDLLDDIIYIDDLLNLKLEKISYVLTNCLFYYLIMPIIIGGICSKNKKFSMSFSLFLLVILILNIKDETFKNCLFAILFLDSFPINDSIDYFLKIDNLEYLNIENYLDSLGKSENNENIQKNENRISFFELISSHYTYQFFLTIVINDSNIIYNNYTQNYPKLLEIANNKKLCEKINENSFSNSKILPKEIEENLKTVIDSMLTSEEKINIKKYHEYLSECTGIYIGNFYKDYTSNKNEELIFEKNILIFMNKVFSNIKNNKIINNSNKNKIKECLFNLTSSQIEEELILFNILVFIVQYEDTKINKNLLKITGIENIFTKNVLNPQFKNIVKNMNFDKNTKRDNENIANNNFEAKLCFNKNNFNFSYNFFSCLDNKKILNDHYLFLPELLSKIFLLKIPLLPITYELLYLNIINLLFDHNFKLNIKIDKSIIINRINKKYKSITLNIYSLLSSSHFFRENGYNIFYNQWLIYSRKNSNETYNTVKNKIISSIKILLLSTIESNNENECDEDLEKDENTNLINKNETDEIICPDKKESRSFDSIIFTFMVVSDLKFIFENINHNQLSKNFNEVKNNGDIINKNVYTIKEKFPLDNSQNDFDLDKEYNLDMINPTKIYKQNINYKLHKKENYSKGIIITYRTYLYLGISLNKENNIVKIIKKIRISNIEINCVNIVEDKTENDNSCVVITHKNLNDNMIIIILFENYEKRDNFIDNFNQKVLFSVNDERIFFVDYFDGLVLQFDDPNN